MTSAPTDAADSAASAGRSPLPDSASATASPATDAAPVLEPTPPDQVPLIPWTELGLSADALKLIAEAGFTKPSPVQVAALPHALAGKDLIASAQTGSGKTAAFALPMIEQFVGREGTFGLVLAPTRELAQQIHATFEIFGKSRGIRSMVLIGGVNMRFDTEAIATYPQVIIATPGRLCDHLDRGNIWLDYIEVVVLDEADRMLDMGFADQLNRIMEEVPTDRQTLLFSATIPPDVDRLARKILHEPERVMIGKPLSANRQVDQSIIRCEEARKPGELMRQLRRETGPVIVFTRSKDGATRCWRMLHSNGFYDATYIHSDRLQAHREQALAEFKSGKYRILVATDVAGRGIHVEDVGLVVNYDLPMEPEDYIHRIGRTGRKDTTGRAVTLITPRDRVQLSRIEKLLNKEIPEYGGRARPTQDELDASRPSASDRGGRGGERGGRGGRGGGGGGGGGSRRDGGRPPRAEAGEARRPDSSEPRPPRDGNRPPRDENRGPRPTFAPRDPNAPAPAPNGADRHSGGGAPRAAAGPGDGAPEAPFDPNDPNAPKKRRRRRGGRGRRGGAGRREGQAAGGTDGAPASSGDAPRGGGEPPST